MKTRADTAGSGHDRIRRRILTPLGGVLVLLISLSIYGIYQLRLQYLEEDFQERISDVRKLLREEMARDAQILSAQIDQLENAPGLRDAWLSGDRESLLERSAPIFERLRSEHGVTHLSFVGPERICFLRVHNPRRHGDRIDRFTVAAAEENIGQEWGVALGSLGTFALRVMRPVRVKGRLAGYIELGEGINRITPRLKSVLDTEVFYSINKGYLHRERWHEGMASMEHAVDWDAFPNYVVVDRTREDLPARVSEYLEQLGASDAAEHITFTMGASKEGNDFIVAFIPLIDARHRDVGDMIVMKDVTAQNRTTRQLLALLIGGGIVTSGLLLAFLYPYIGCIEDRISRQHRALALEIEERRKNQEALKEAMAVKSGFVSVVSHELRTPLTAIKQGIEIVTDGEVGELTELQCKFLGIAQVNVDRLARMINDVLDFQKMESGKMELRVQECDMNDIVQGVHDTMAPVAREKGLDLVTELDDTMPAVKFDRDKIIQVLTNLVSNAIKFTEKGMISIRCWHEGNSVRAAVRDTGAGIKKEDIPKLFHRFEQLETTKTGGTGLGLAISKEIVDLHRGKIWIESEEGKGSTFLFLLPIKERRISRTPGPEVTQGTRPLAEALLA